MSTLHLDFETASACDLRKAGVHVYAQHPSTHILCTAWAFDDEPVQSCDGFRVPDRVIKHVADGGLVTAHNAVFERTIWDVVGVRVLRELPPLTIQQMDCTMARGSILAYPAALDDLALALRVPHKKDAAGKKLMTKLCKPRKIHDGDTPTYEWWLDDPDYGEEWLARLRAYCEQDVRAERDIDRALPPLSAVQRKVWEFDQLVNERGVPVDLEELRIAQEIIEFAKEEANNLIAELTHDAVKKVTENAKIKAWLATQGVFTETLESYALSKIDISDKPLVQEVLKLRKAAGKTSLAKYSAMEKCLSNGRLKGQYFYAGCNTGRWSARLVQPQNFPRLDMKSDGVKVDCIFDAAIELFGGDVEAACRYLTVMTGEPTLTLFAKGLRRFIKAPIGMRFIGGDFAQIEARWNAWVSGCAWKTEAFRSLDVGQGPDIYIATASRVLGLPLDEITSSLRQAYGKVPELAFGYQGAVGALVSMAEVYGVDPKGLIGPMKATTAPDVWSAQAVLYKSARDKFGLDEDTWIAVKLLVARWRDENAEITESWWRLQKAAIDAIQAPSTIIEVPNYKGVSYIFHGGNLYCALPSGRKLCYADAQIAFISEDFMEFPDGTQVPLNDIPLSTRLFLSENGLAEIVHGKTRKSVRFMGKVLGKWASKYLYGGLQCENIDQASCFDIQARGLLTLESKGYPIVLHTHDEACSLVPYGSGDIGEFKYYMSQVPSFCQGLPISVSCWEDERYGK